MANTYDISDFPQILLIDTNDARSTTVAFVSVESILIETEQTRAQEILVLIERLLKKSATDLRTITAIGNIEREGSLTGQRIGTAVANTLAWLLNVPLFELSGEINELSEEIRNGAQFKIVKTIHAN